MKFGVRSPSLKKRIAARTSVKRVIRHSLGLKGPRGWGWLTNPRRAAYNRVYNRTTIGCGTLIALVIIAIPVLLLSAHLAFARGGGGGHSGGHSSGSVHVNGYYRQDGTYVQPHTRTAPDGIKENNLSYHEPSTNTPSTIRTEPLSPIQKREIREDVSPSLPRQLESKITPSPEPLPSSKPEAGKAPAVHVKASYPSTIKKHRSLKASEISSNKRGHIKRSAAAKRDFMKQTGYPNGRPGYVVDHIIPLKRGGSDDPSNMQWQTIQDAKAKDKWE